MPTKIVEQYRRLYDKFEQMTVRHLPNVQIVVPMYEGAFGFPGCDIVVNFAGEKHNKIWAVNFVQHHNGTYQGYIQVNTDLCLETPEMQKMILAEEWIEVMIGLRDRERGNMQKRIKDKVALALLFNSLGKRSFWQDSPGQQIELHGALRLLLVSEESIAKILSETFSESLDSLKTKVAVNPNEASRLMNSLVDIYAAKHAVKPELVWDRVMEVLQV